MARIAIVGAAFVLGVLVALMVWWPRKPVAAPSPAPAPPSAAPGRFAQARELLDRGELDAAAGEVREELKRGDAAEGNAILGFIQYRKRDYAGAASLLDRAQRLDPSHPATYAWRGQVHMACERWREARADFEEYVRLRPGRADGYALRAAARFHQDELAGAIEDAVRALQIDPACADAYFVRGASLGTLGRSEAAIGDYTKCIDLKPDHAEAICNRGNLYARGGEMDRAVRDWERAIELKPELRDVLQPLIDEARGR